MSIKRRINEKIDSFLDTEDERKQTNEELIETIKYNFVTVISLNIVVLIVLLSWVGWMDFSLKTLTMKLLVMFLPILDFMLYFSAYVRANELKKRLDVYEPT